jgi:hypothetical protein
MMPTQFLANFPPSLGSEVAAGQHYMMIDSYESTNAISRGKTKLSSIGLYIPTGSLKTSFSGNYEGKEGASLKAAGGAAGGNLIDKLSKFDFSVKAAADLISAGSDAANVAGGFAEKMFASTLDKTGFVSASGNSPNNYMALVYGGPNEFRQHSFAFKFFPRNPAETTTVKAIIEEFKRGTLPRMSTSVTGATGKNLLDPFFKSPRQHTIKFMKGGKTGGGNENTYLFTIGKSVITNMEINYDPQGTVGFHDDGSPVAIDLSLTFKEIAFQISPDNVNGQNKDLRGPILQNQAQATRAEGLAALSARGQVAAGQGFSSPTRDF